MWDLLGEKHMNASPSTAAIILAAGSSSRMGAGRHKLLLPLGDRPVLAHAIDATLTSQARPIIIVLGHQADLVRTQIAPYATHPDITIIENPNYLQGMSTSMHAGIQALMGTLHQQTWHSQGVPLHFKAEPDSALIILGDQPFITPQIIDTLIAARQTTGKRIVAPFYNGKRGNPILLEASLFLELLEVTGDEGGRSIVEHHYQEMATVELGDAMASYDVDTWEAYQQVLEAWQRKEGSSPR